MKVLGSIARRCFRGRAFSRLLEGCGIEPRRYWLLVDLFQTLGNRGEVARMGNQDYSMRFLVIFWFFMASLISLGMAVEGLILAHQPVNGATWSGAKLSHLIKAVVYVVAGINGVPALVGLFLPHGDRFHRMVYPLAHLLIRPGSGDGGRPALLQPVRLVDSLHSRPGVSRRLPAWRRVVPMLFMFGFQVLIRFVEGPCGLGRIGRAIPEMAGRSRFGTGRIPGVAGGGGRRRRVGCYLLRSAGPLGGPPGSVSPA